MRCDVVRCACPTPPAGPAGPATSSRSRGRAQSIKATQDGPVGVEPTAVQYRMGIWSTVVVLRTSYEDQRIPSDERYFASAGGRCRFQVPLLSLVAPACTTAPLLPCAGLYRCISHLPGCQWPSYATVILLEVHQVLSSAASRGDGDTVMLAAGVVCGTVDEMYCKLQDEP